MLRHCSRLTIWYAVTISFNSLVVRMVQCFFIARHRCEPSSRMVGRLRDTFSQSMISWYSPCQHYYLNSPVAISEWSGEDRFVSSRDPARCSVACLVTEGVRMSFRAGRWRVGVPSMSPSLWVSYAFLFAGCTKETYWNVRISIDSSYGYKR